MSVTHLGSQEIRKFVEISSAAILSELSHEFFTLILRAGVEIFHFFESEDSILIVIDDSEEGFGEVFFS